MKFYLLSPSQRIIEWRNFRQSLIGKDEMLQLAEVARFWSEVPIQTYALDWDKASEWPNAWQLINDGDFDTNVIAILMEQTLILLGWDSYRLKLMYIKDTKIEDQMMILVIDDKWILNYSYSEVFELDKIKDNYSAFIKYQIQGKDRIEIK